MLLASQRVGSVRRERLFATLANETLGGMTGALSDTPNQAETSATVDAPGRPGAPGGAPARLAAGTKVGRFVVVQLVAEGGMGALYKAYDPELDRAVALKLVRDRGPVPPAEIEADVQRERLLREARALAKLSHPNVVTVYEVGFFGDEVFIAMEFVVGTTLRAWLSAEKRTRGSILASFQAAALGLGAAHRAGLVHRDVKPENILVGADGRVRVVDFGLARTQHVADVESTIDRPLGPARARAVSLSDADASASSPSLDDGISATASGPSNPSPLTVVGSRMGTPRYMAPEQHLGLPATDKSDQFSFCVALYEALYESHPFAIDAGRSRKVDGSFAERVVKGRVAAPSRESSVPSFLRAALLRGLAPVESERFGSMDALLAAVRADPAAARRAWAWRVLALASACAMVAVAVYATKRPALLCARAPSPLTNIWNPARAQAVRDAFGHTGLSYADEAAAGVGRALDGYVAEWSTLATATCVAREEHSVSVESADGTSRCLDERLNELRALSDMLTRGGEKTVSHALSVSLALPSPADCGKAGRLEGGPPLPRDEATRARVVALARQRAEAATLADLGQHDDARARLEALLPQAEATAHAPLIADVLFDLGRACEYTLDYKSAEATLLRCIDVADASRHDRTRAGARILLVRVAYSQSHYEEALAHAEHAMAVVHRIGDEALEAQLLMQRAWARIFSSHAGLALVDARLGLTLATRVLGPKASLTAELHSVLGSAAGELEKYDEAERESREALSIVESVYSEHNERTARMAENLSLVLGYAEKWGEARAQQERAVAIAKALWGANDSNTAIKMQNLGGLLVDMHKSADAIPILETAAAIFERDPVERDSQWMAYTLNALGGAYVDEGLAARAVPQLERAVSLAEKGALDPDIAGQSRVRLARALLARGVAGDRPRALSLAREGAAELAKVPRLAKELVVTKAWLSALERDATKESPSRSAVRRVAEGANQ